MNLKKDEGMKDENGDQWNEKQIYNKVHNARIWVFEKINEIDKLTTTQEKYKFLKTLLRENKKFNTKILMLLWVYI